MPCYSSDQFFQDWRYAVEKDFTTSDGKSFPYADNGKQQWGDEIKKISFKEEPHNGCISSDGRRLAVAVNHDIHVLETETWDTISILKGHISQVSAIAFKPNDSNTLVSSEQHDYGRSDPKAEPTIIVWKVDEVKGTLALESDSLAGISEAAAATAAEKLASFDVEVTKDELQDLEGAFTAAVSDVVTKHIIKDNLHIVGRLQNSFQSEIFSPSGKWMIYMPGKAPRSNSDAVWDINICSTDDFKCYITLKGHTDAIMWTGWNPDESLIATVAWDGTIRIWDAATGRQTHRFDTGRQNWAGAFSANSKYFVATDGSGNVLTYELSSEERVERVYKAEGLEHWRRAVGWHPNGKWVAVGGERCGELLLLDVEKQEVFQERILSVEGSRSGTEALRDMMKGFVGVSEMRFVDRGHKLAVWAYGDCSIEVYDMTQQVKWRFARGGTEDGPEANKWRDENGKTTSKWGHGMLVWEDQSNRRLLLASIDFDGVRIWSLKLTEASEQ